MTEEVLQKKEYKEGDTFKVFERGKLRKYKLDEVREIDNEVYFGTWYPNDTDRYKCMILIKKKDVI